MWLDVHREVKSQLHDARLHITRRDQATSAQKQHESSAAAKSCLVKAGQGISALVTGLKNISAPQGSKGGGWGDNATIGEGEVRRRKDLIASLRKEKDGLDNLLSAMDTKAKLDQAVSTISSANPTARSMLNTYANSSSSSVSTQPRSSRVLGRETDKTRELDNKGLLQMQREEMADQDLEVEDLLKIVRRQKELGLAINQELQEQSEMLAIVDDDVDRLVSLMLVFREDLWLMVYKQGSNQDEYCEEAFGEDFLRGFPRENGRASSLVVGRPMI